MYALVFATMRLTGKKQIGQLQPYEVTVAIMISALAAIPMEDVSIPLTNSIIPILLLLSGQVLVSMLSMKVNKVQAFCVANRAYSLKTKAGGTGIKESR